MTRRPYGDSPNVATSDPGTVPQAYDPTAINTAVQTVTDAGAQGVQSVVSQAQQMAPIHLVKIGFFAYTALTPRLPGLARIAGALLGLKEWADAKAEVQQMAPVQIPLVPPGS